VSINPSTYSNVDLPRPDGPVTAVTFPGVNACDSPPNSSSPPGVRKPAGEDAFEPFVDYVRARLSEDPHVQAFAQRHDLANARTPTMTSRHTLSWDWVELPDPPTCSTPTGTLAAAHTCA